MHIHLRPLGCVAQWLRRASQGHEMFWFDPEVKASGQTEDAQSYFKLDLNKKDKENTI